MGVSKFHAWLVEQFGSAASDARGKALAADHVVVDMTSVVQSAARRCKSGREAVKRVVGRVESIFTSSKTATTHAVCRARTSVGFFLDGPLPRAKVVTVRQRRLKAKDGVRADGLVTERGARRPSPNRIPPFDVLEISPGTDFSERLAEALGQWAEKRTRRDLGVPSCGGAFTPSTRLVRNAAARQGFDEVVVSDASVPGDGEVKCVEYLDACAREAARSGDPQPREVVLYGGDVDLVVMALCRAQPGPGPVFGPHVRSILVLSDAGRVLDVGALADALCARVARKNDEEDPTLERRQVALDFATLAVAAGGNDYLPPLSVASHALWDAYKAQDRALYDEASGRVDLEVLGSLLEDRHDAATIDEKRRRVAEDARSHTRTKDGRPAAPRALELALLRKADRVGVRVLAPRDFGAVTSGAATLLYRVEWRPVPVQPRDSDDSIPRRRTPPPVSTAPWRVAIGADGSRLNRVELRHVDPRVEIRAPAGGGPLEVRCRARNHIGWGRARTTRLKRDPRWCVQQCPQGQRCTNPQCVHAHEIRHLAEEWPRAGNARPPQASGVWAQRTFSSVPAKDEESDAETLVGSDDEVVAWAEGEWLSTLEWCVTTYARGHCRDFSRRYARPAAPPPEALIGYCASMRGVDRDSSNDEYVPPPPPAESLACLLPGRRAAHLLPLVLRPLFEDGSPVADAWHGAVADVPLDRILEAAAALRRAAPPELDAAAPSAFGAVVRYRASPYTGLVDVDVCPAAEGRQHYDSMPPRGAPPPRGVFYDPNQGAYDPSQAYMVPQYARHYPGHYYAAPIPLAPIPSDAGSSGPPSPPAPRRTRRPRRRGSPRDSPVGGEDEAETAPPQTEASTASVQAPRDQTRCRFFFSARGCKRGAGCWFLHSEEPEASPVEEDESKSK